jgi:HEAT repeat protein
MIVPSAPQTPIWARPGHALLGSIVLLFVGGLLAVVIRSEDVRDLPEQPTSAALTPSASVQETSLSALAGEFADLLREMQSSPQANPSEQEERPEAETRSTAIPKPNSEAEEPGMPAGNETARASSAERGARNLLDVPRSALCVPRWEDPAAPAKELEGPVPLRPIKRRHNWSEPDLRKQLAQAPEIRSFTLDSMAALVKGYQEGMKFSGGDWNNALEPTCLLRQRPDLANLPVRAGSASRLNRRAAAILEILSKKLHAYVDNTIKDPANGLPDPSQLRETLRSEKRGKRLEWLRPEAVPVLLQLLMHEATPIRELLVEVLAEIEGKTASAALAQRAVFDLSPEVRQAAVRALASRPRADYRHVFIQALRYPWAPAADHAAEALAALEDQEVVPLLIALLKKPDPTLPVPSTSNRQVVREVVRINHRSNCLMCHPPAVKGGDPVTGMVPGVSMKLPESNFRMLAMCKETGRVVVNPLLVRADVTFMRQDFSVRQPTILPGSPVAEELRFDYLIRTRPARVEELARLRDASKTKAAYEQREAVLFALRELTGQDPGPSTEAWQQLFPEAEIITEAARLAAMLVRAPVNLQERHLDQYQRGTGPVYTQALALAIPRLKGFVRDKARQALAERLAQATDAALAAGLRDAETETRRAAARACSLKKARANIPDLIGLLEDREPAVVEAAHSALKELTDQDFGPTAGAAWKDWWEKQDAG